MLVERDRVRVQRLNDALLVDFPELAPGVVLGTVTRVRRDLARLGDCEGREDVVELVARERLVEARALRGA